MPYVVLCGAHYGWIAVRHISCHSVSAIALKSQDRIDSSAIVARLVIVEYAWWQYCTFVLALTALG